MSVRTRADATSDIQLDLADHLTAAQRETAQRSVTAMADHTAEEAVRIRTAEAERQELRDVVTRPFVQLIEADPGAVARLEELRTREVVRAETVSTLHTMDRPATWQDVPFGIGGSVDVKALPFDFSWSWFNAAGSAPFDRRFDPPTGNVGLDARSGLGPGGASSFVDAHAGYGVILTADRTVTATGRALRRMRHHYTVAAAGIGCNAVAEGGVEFTALENGVLVASTRESLFRSRVSGSITSPSESDTGDSGGFALGGPMELSWTMHPGREYTFNVGAWAWTDRSIGLGAAAAQSIVEGDIFLMSIERT